MEKTNEQEIMVRNRKYLSWIVSDFMRRCRAENRSGVLSREDLMQEAAICFLLEVRRYGEEIARSHRRTLFHALYEAVRQAYPVSISYHSFSGARLQPLQVEPWEAMEAHITAPDTAGRIIDRLNVKTALEALEAPEKKIIACLMRGMNQREIARLFGWTDCQVCRRIKRIRRQLDRKN